MSKMMRSAWFVVVLILLGRAAAAQEPDSAGADEKAIGSTLFFENDESFANAKPLPEVVLNALLRDKMTGYARDVHNENPSKDLNQFFRSSVVHLAGSSETDYVINGLFPLAGADCAWFWVVLREGNQAKVVLFDNSNSIRILKHETNGHHDLETVWTSAAANSKTHVFRFDGRRYRLARQYETMVKEDR